MKNFNLENRRLRDELLKKFEVVLEENDRVIATVVKANAGRRKVDPLKK